MKLKRVQRVSLIVLLAFIVTLAFSLFPLGKRNEIHGFRLIKQSYIGSIQSTVFQYEHVKSGAKLIYLKNDDKNRTFSISFRTPPDDNSGVNHIIEHCLLDGSENYPVKSIVSAMKSRSMYTFFNAYTGSDVTGYVASSTNERDFQNLIYVYMDAVFHPNVLHNKNIFLQEAGHYEFDPSNSELSYTGVVYNEVKDGASSPYELLYSKIYQSLLPDTVYRWNSGGDPAEIPKLTYEKLIETYRKYYHPSNSYIYLYGDINIDETLNILDSEYLNSFSKKEIDSDINPQSPLAKSIETTYEYLADEDVAPEDGGYLSWSCVLEEAANAEVSKAFEIIGSLLFDEGSSFRKALSDKGFRDISYSIDVLRQPIFTILCENIDADRRNEFAETIKTELEKIVKQGFDKKKISALRHSYEAKPYQEERGGSGLNARGVLYSRKVLTTWLYDGDPFASLDYSIDINILNKELSGNYLEKFIQKYMINNVQKAVIALKPQRRLDKEVGEKQFEAYKQLLSKDQIVALIKQSEDLKRWQSEPDSAEALSKMPVLKLSDIEKDINYSSPDIETVDGMTILFTPVNTNGMNYITFYFDTSTVPQDKIQYIKLLEALLGRVGTEKYDSESMINELQSSTSGDLTFYSYHYEDMEHTDDYSPKILVAVSALDKDLDKTIDLLNQILVRTVFNDKEQLHNMIHQQKIMIADQATSTYMGMLRLYSYFSNKDRYYERLYGHPYYEFINKLDKDFEKNSNEIINNLTQVYNCIFNKNNVTVAFVGSKGEYAIFRSKLNSLFEGMSTSKLVTYNYKFTNDYINEGMISTQTVNSVNMGYDFKKLGYEYNGSMAVLQTILDEYLFNEVRAKGGAYGVKTYIDRDGKILFYSSRDPNIIETLNAFKGAASYIRGFYADQQEMTNYIISTISRIDGELYSGSISNACASQSYFMMGGSKELYQKEREEILHTTAEDIRALADVIQAVIDKNCYCVAGSEADITSHKDIFSRIVRLGIPN